MEEEKAAVKRSLAQEARFREEKQQIVASMGGSPVELLTPSADRRLQRKLQNNSKPGASSLLAQDSDPEYQDSLLPTRLPVHAAPTDAVVDVVIVNDEHPIPLNHTAEHEQYHDDQERREGSRKYNKKVYLFAAGAFLALTLGSIIGVLAALLTGPNISSSPSSTSEGGGANDQCELDREALAQCTNGRLAVPDCAKAAYLELADGPYVLGEEICDSAHKGLVALAVALTNHGDNFPDPNMFYAMSTLYFALEGVKWRDESGWLKGSSPCSSAWYGVECYANGLFSLRLDNNRLEGTIPTEIGLLSNLETFRVNNNPVSGSLPSEIGMLSNLRSVSTELTWIRFSLPSEIGKLEDLRDLILANCAMTGTIPAEIGNLTNLEFLDLRSNQFTGTIPEETRNLLNLRDLRLTNILEISGALPSNLLVRLSNLHFLYINLPSIDPSPTLLQDILMTTSLEDVMITGTDLSSSLPSEIGVLSNLTRLILVFADLTGTVPSEMGLLTKLTQLKIEDSSFLTGQLPSELGNLSNLEKLSWAGTRLSGTIPTEICALKLTFRDMFCQGHNAIRCRSDVIDTCS